MIPFMDRNKKGVIYILSLLLLAVIFLPQCIDIIKDLWQWLSDPAMVKEWLDGFGIWSYVILFLAVIAKIILPMLPGKVLEIAAGYCFGFWQALFLLLSANAAGTLLVHMLVHKLRHTKLWPNKNEEALKRFSLWQKESSFAALLALVYLLPGTPKDALTYVVSLSPLKAWKIVVITTAARSFTVAFGVAQGCAFQEGDIIRAFVLMGIFALLALSGTWIYQKLILRKAPLDESCDDQ